MPDMMRDLGGVLARSFKRLGAARTALGRPLQSAELLDRRIEPLSRTCEGKLLHWQQSPLSGHMGH